MKFLYVLPVLLTLPMGAFARYERPARYDDAHVRPFIGYSIKLANTMDMKIKTDNEIISSADGLYFNNENSGAFVLGLEFEDALAVSIIPSLERTKAVGDDFKQNEVDFEFDVYLTRNSNTKPFISLSAGYLTLDGANQPRTSGAVFGVGLGCRQYVTDNAYLIGNLSYDFTTEMKVKEISHVPVDNTTLKISGFNLTIGAGYRF